ncbi:hypothetical protein ABW19_dt0205735 [Dactylella cylindrospora]|nr:hypothetical protein ABW19_dt0205735 [Dactylella cylindrospora]
MSEPPQQQSELPGIETPYQLFRRSTQGPKRRYYQNRNTGAKILRRWAASQIAKFGLDPEEAHFHPQGFGTKLDPNFFEWDCSDVSTLTISELEALRNSVLSDRLAARATHWKLGEVEIVLDFIERGILQARPRQGPPGGLPVRPEGMGLEYNIENEQEEAEEHSCDSEDSRSAASSEAVKVTSRQAAKRRRVVHSPDLGDERAEDPQRTPSMPATDAPSPINLTSEPSTPPRSVSPQIEKVTGPVSSPEPDSQDVTLRALKKQLGSLLETFRRKREQQSERIVSLEKQLACANNEKKMLGDQVLRLQSNIELTKQVENERLRQTRSTLGQEIKWLKGQLEHIRDPVDKINQYFEAGSSYLVRPPEIQQAIKKLVAVANAG